MRIALVGTLLGCMILQSFSAHALEETFSVNGSEVVLDLTPHTLAGQSDNAGEHFSGTVKGIVHSWVRLSRIDGQWQGLVSIDDTLHLIEPAEEASVNRAARAVSSAAIPFSCGTTTTLGNASAVTDLNQAMRATTAGFDDLCDESVAGTCAVVELELAFDKDFVSTYPSNYRSQAQSLINMVEGLYLNNFGIAFDTLSTTYLTTKVFTGEDDISDNYLDDIAKQKAAGKLSFVSNDSAILHVIRGKAFSDVETAGIAYINGLCNDHGLSSGTSVLYREDRLSSPSIPITALVTTHEIGHNLGADHDGEKTNTCDGGFIMDAIVNTEASRFSTCSVNEIETLLGDLSEWAACTDYPVKLQLNGDADNNLSLPAPETLTHRFELKYEQGYSEPTAPAVTGTLDGASASEVTLDDVACTLSSDGQSYSCAYPRTSTATLAVTLTPFWTVATITSAASFGSNSNFFNTAKENASLSYQLITDGPSSPSSLTATTSGDNVILTWQDSGDEENGYRVEHRINGGAWQLAGSVDANILTFTDTSSAALALHEYRVLTSTPDIFSSPSNTTKVDKTPVPASASTSGGGGGGGGVMSWWILASAMLIRRNGVNRRSLFHR